MTAPRNLTAAELRARLAGTPDTAGLPEALLERLAAEDPALRAQAAAELTELYNLTWREGQAPVDEAGFAAALTLVQVGWQAGALQWLRYTAPALIGPAAVVLYADDEGRGFRACIEA